MWVFSWHTSKTAYNCQHQHCSQIYNLHVIVSLNSGIYPPVNNNLCLPQKLGRKAFFFRRLIKMQSLLILMCFGIKLNQQQQLGSESKGISSTKNCSPTTILSNLQATISYSIDYMTALSTEIESLLV